ncbi:alpha-glucosidase [Pleomorphomonas diazotrophica]|uniref:Alpha-glucosidase n=1 Tax=Pleomorphomonas diazotrophica TaxID=1166257 RepID=A0A2N3M2N4_9HYPH|nr:alpha-glucosidase [Pleomorphomonas diazotrophica]PKR91130.1 alpha-glucosidase [Pleomorphomonas diazotrophica]
MTTLEKAVASIDRATDPDWWRGAVIYQIYPRSFQDSNGDGIGDLAGVTARLGYLEDLGVDAIWLSPFFKSPMKDFGYDVSDYCDIDPIFGTLDDFRKMVAAAHRRGIKVIIDQVLSHTSDQHPWFAESRKDQINAKADWYVWADAQPDGTPPNNWLSVFGGSAWEWDTRRCQYYLHNFLSSQPDLNFHTPAVQDALLDVLKFWLDLGVDGFRLDTVNFYFHDKDLRPNPPQTRPVDAIDAPRVNPYLRQDHVYDKSQPENLDFLKRMRKLLDQYPGSTTVGEIGDGDRSLKTMIAYTSGGDKLHMSYTFDLLGGEPSRTYIEKTLKTFEAGAGDAWPCWALSNHDVVRYATRHLPFAQNPAQQGKLMATLHLSLRGSVCIYEGDELGLTEADLAFEDLVDPYGIRFWPEFKGRDGCRTPMVWEAEAANAGFSPAKPWLPVPQAHLAKAVDQQVGKADSQYELYKAMIGWRKTSPALTKGSVRFLDSDGDTLAFLREAAGEKVLCVFNFGKTGAGFPVPLGLAVSETAGIGFASRVVEGMVTLPAESAFIAKVK